MSKYIEYKKPTSWWAKSWNKNLESYSDYSNRLPRARSYFKKGSVLEVNIESGFIGARIQGSRSSPYIVNIEIDEISEKKQNELSSELNGEIENLEALISGTFPESMKNLFEERETGLFPSPREIRFGCSCPDWASMCKHVGAVLYAIGTMFDDDPTLFFTLRGIDTNKFLKKSTDAKIEELLKITKKRTKRYLDDDKVKKLFS